MFVLVSLVSTSVFNVHSGCGKQTPDEATLEPCLDPTLLQLPPRKIVLTNTRFLGSRTVQMDWNSNVQTNTSQRDDILVYGYQDNSADNFQVY